ncbi:hypothetical protein POM88_035815 [Heracleum sosnowskyi]|uniref:DUF4283 domain-containing protein n=1 Tax=Heracleum sosnowskyi TaxID=360622 RepID=A0AAD8MF17_9APIA|nr:hypothetical protein POM88_035815 [Heracleum sosnowskyi]
MPAGVKVVSPPEAVLKLGNEKFKTSILGTFTRGAPPYLKVADFARKAWDGKGLTHISQKDSHNYVFKFDMVDSMNAALSRGTWYLGNQPMLVHAWVSKVGEKSSMPLWVKFENVPDSYWTREGLSYLGSIIGSPLSADELTSKLEIVPFAKLCVDYKIGGELPSKIEVEVLDPVTELKHVEEVKVSYPNKPLVCSSCKSLGHLVGACPSGSRLWVRKDRASPQIVSTTDGGIPIAEQSLSGQSKPTLEKIATDEGCGATSKEALKIVDQPTVSPDSQVDIAEQRSLTNENIEERPWQTVQSKKSKLGTIASSSSSLDGISEMAGGLKCPNMPIYTALAKSLSRGKQKRNRKSGGSRSPSH